MAKIMYINQDEGLGMLLEKRFGKKLPEHELVKAKTISEAEQNLDSDMIIINEIVYGRFAGDIALHLRKAEYQGLFVYDGTIPIADEHKGLFDEKTEQLSGIVQIVKKYFE